MKKKLALMMTLLGVAAFAFTGCADKTKSDKTKETVQETGAQEADGEEGDVADITEPEIDTVTIRVGSLKGATSMGIAQLINRSNNGETDSTYEFTMETAADALLTSMVQGNLDIALIPANVASVLYNKTEGQITVIDINTLGVLYMVTGDTKVSTLEDLKGKTIYLTGKGTTPDYVLQYILKENNLTDEVTLEYKSEATEVAAVLAENPNEIGLLPQPFVTAACIQNDALSIVFDMNEEWNKLQGEGGSQLVTGVTVVRNEFLAEHENAVLQFMADHKESVQFANSNVSETAAFVVELGIIEKQPIAEAALPKCNITYLDGSEMQQALSGYLQVLFEQDPSSVGGTLPEENCYYVNQ